MNWLILIMAGVMEVIWAIGMKYSFGFTKLTPSIVTVVAMSISVLLLSIAMKHFSLGTAYVIWTGIGAAGTAIAGMYFFGESREPMKIVCIFLIIAGIVGLKIFSKS